jgi:integrative and conjugative element protein (TIGR02256 family)
MKRRSRRIVVQSGASDELENVVARTSGTETGGILVGYRQGRDVVISRIVEVKDRGAGYASYTRDPNRAQELLDDRLEASTSDKSLLGYVGEWHTHPVPSPPSHQDLKELRAVAKLASGSVALLVVTGNPSGSTLAPRGWVASRRRASEALVEFVVHS